MLHVTTTTATPLSTTGKGLRKLPHGKSAQLRAVVAAKLTTGEWQVSRPLPAQAARLCRVAPARIARALDVQRAVAPMRRRFSFRRGEMTRTKKLPCFGPTGFIPDHERMPPFPESPLAYKAAAQQQMRELSESDLADDARELIADVSKHWCYGVYAVQGLAALAREKYRRLVADGEDDPHEELAAWFRALGIAPYESYIPKAGDCLALITEGGPHADSDGLGRPGFYDDDK